MSAGSGRAPGAATTMAFTASPQRSSGTPMTAASATPGAAQDRVLHLGRIDVLAAGDDHVLHPVVDEEVAVLVAVAGVAGSQPAVGPDRLGGGLGRFQ
jgi:hypothetical protein